MVFTFDPYPFDASGEGLRLLAGIAEVLLRGHAGICQACPEHRAALETRVAQK